MRRTILRKAHQLFGFFPLAPSLRPDPPLLCSLTLIVVHAVRVDLVDDQLQIPPLCELCYCEDSLEGVSPAEGVGGVGKDLALGSAMQPMIGLVRSRSRNAKLNSAKTTHQNFGLYTFLLQLIHFRIEVLDHTRTRRFFGVPDVDGFEPGFGT